MTGPIVLNFLNPERLLTGAKDGIYLVVHRLKRHLHRFVLLTYL